MWLATVITAVAKNPLEWRPPNNQNLLDRTIQGTTRVRPALPAAFIFRDVDLSLNYQLTEVSRIGVTARLYWSVRRSQNPELDHETIITSSQLRRTINAQLFRPLKIHLADGREVDIKHPEFIAASPTEQTRINFYEDEAFEAIDVLNITSIEVPNGRKKRTKKPEHSHFA